MVPPHTLKTSTSSDDSFHSPDVEWEPQSVEPQCVGTSVYTRSFILINEHHVMSRVEFMLWTLCVWLLTTASSIQLKRPWQKCMQCQAHGQLHACFYSVCDMAAQSFPCLRVYTEATTFLWAKAIQWLSSWNSEYPIPTQSHLLTMVLGFADV